MELVQRGEIVTYIITSADRHQTLAFRIRRYDDTSSEVMMSVTYTVLPQGVSRIL